MSSRFDTFFEVSVEVTDKAPTKIIMPKFILSSASDHVSESSEESPPESMASIMGHIKTGKNESLMTFMGDPEVQAKGNVFFWKKKNQLEKDNALIY